MRSRLPASAHDGPGAPAGSGRKERHRALLLRQAQGQSLLDQPGERQRLAGDEALASLSRSSLRFRVVGMGQGVDLPLGFAQDG